MKVNIAILAFATVFLTAAPVMAGNPADPAGPGSDKSVGVTPNDAQASPTVDARQPPSRRVLLIPILPTRPRTLLVQSPKTS